MRHYKDASGQVFGYDETQRHLVKPDMVEMTTEEFEAFRNPPLTREQEISIRIRDLEASQTPRRQREALLTDEGKAWMQGVEDEIAALRETLNKG